MKSSQETQAEIYRISLGIITVKFNAFIEECIDDMGKPKVPNYRALMTARGYIPAGHAMTLQKGGGDAHQN